MSGPSIPELFPPVIPANYVLDEFRWCQVLYLYYRELQKRDVPHDQAVLEAREVASILETSGVPLTPDPWMGSQGPLVHWPTLICAANAYASLPPERRAYVRENFRAGASPAYVMLFGEGGCERKVLDDEEYLPAPPCIPSVASKGFFLAIGTLAVVYGGLALLFGGSHSRSSAR